LEEAGMDRTIKVTGGGRIAVKPDTLRLLIDLRDRQKSYEDTLQQSACQMEKLKDCVEKLGFARTDLKTISFRVDTRYESDKSWKQKFVGYEFRHSLKLEFDIDNQLLGKLLYALAQSPVEPELRIVYMVKDAEKAKNLLLEKAVEDSRKKAELLTKAAGVALGEVVTIDYSWEEMEIVAKPMNLLRAAGDFAARGQSYQMDMEPEDIDLSDHVTVIWSIQ